MSFFPAIPTVLPCNKLQQAHLGKKLAQKEISTFNHHIAAYS